MKPRLVVDNTITPLKMLARRLEQGPSGKKGPMNWARAMEHYFGVAPPPPGEQGPDDAF